ncbi:MAG: 16S rRNA (cytosine(1402)-N(4))-methyltransferase RsmH [Mycoplasmataceae bacterium]|nr:16S rRNA (cytosine(1402)-N(4))-methyltransferase RsmH [Mycoplasmataceae bacterium]
MKALDIKENGIYLDLTLGRAGHSKEILKRIPNGLLIAFDKDINAIRNSNSLLSEVGSNFKLIHSDFIKIKSVLDQLGIKAVNGILVDLGVSSPQIDDESRGFSYSKDARLDMRMDQSQELDAHVIVNNYSEYELVEILKNNADVKLPKVISNAIIKNRPINTTEELVNIIRDSLPAKIVRMKNPAKAVFQALRIAVNNELESLKILLSDSIEFLEKDSVLAIISFHSIEDKIIKNFFGKLIKDKMDPKIPIQEEKDWAVKIYSPSKTEIEKNNRSRSSKLRALTKLK